MIHSDDVSLAVVAECILSKDSYWSSQRIISEEKESGLPGSTEES